MSTTLNTLGFLGLPALAGLGTYGALWAGDNSPYGSKEYENKGREARLAAQLAGMGTAGALLPSLLTGKINAYNLLGAGLGTGLGYSMRPKDPNAAPMKPFYERLYHP